VSAADTTAEHAKACQELVEKWAASTMPARSPVALPRGGRSTGQHVGVPGRPWRANWGGAAFDANSRYVFVVTQDVGALGWIEKSRDGSPAPYEKSTGSAVATSMSASTTRIGRARSHHGVA
jgi:hypothetical protein